MGAAKIEVVIAFAVLALLPAISSAQVAFTEIMYDVQGADTGHEWVEVYNAGTIPVKLSSWKLLENGTRHKIVSASGVDSLAPQTYAVIADNAAVFRADRSQFAGALFDSAFSLGNDGDTLGLYDASSTEMGSASYQSSSGAAGDGNSLNRAPGDAGVFAPHTPSPGQPMSTAFIPPPPPKQIPLKTSTPRTSVKKVKTIADATTLSHSAIVGDVATQEDPAASNDSSPESQTAAPTPVAPRSWWWMGAGALALFGGGAMFVSRSRAKGEWKIEEAAG